MCFFSLLVRWLCISKYSILWILSLFVKKKTVMWMFPWIHLLNASGLETLFWIVYCQVLNMQGLKSETVVIGQADQIRISVSQLHYFKLFLMISSSALMNLKSNLYIIFCSLSFKLLILINIASRKLLCCNVWALPQWSECIQSRQRISFVSAVSTCGLVLPEFTCLSCLTHFGNWVVETALCVISNLLY